MSIRYRHRSVDGVEQKYCGRCQQWFPLEGFSTDNSVWDRLCYYCRTCNSVAKGCGSSGRIQHHPHRTVDGLELKLCGACARWLTLDHFCPVRGSGSQSDGLFYWCRDCQRAYSQRRQREHPEEVAAANQRWRESHPEATRGHRRDYRARKAGAEGRFTDAEFRSLCKAMGNRCLCPGMNHEGLLVADHVVPLSKGGRNDISNIQPLCARHNDTKGTKTIDYRVGFEAT